MVVARAARAMTMLLVHHDDELRGMLSADFRQRGWQVSDARDVASAVEAAMRTQPEVILTPLQLPGATGFHFVRTFRSSVEHDVVLVGITSLPVRLCGDAKIAGLDLVVEKPLNVERVHHSIMVAMGATRPGPPRSFRAAGHPADRPVPRGSATARRLRSGGRTRSSA
jgi:two-component system OmpR family response regulator